MWEFTTPSTRKHLRWLRYARILEQTGRFSAPRRTSLVCGVRVSSPARWLPSRGQRLPLRGVRWNCHAPARHAPTAVDVKHVAHPSTISLMVPFTHPRRIYWHNPLALQTTGGEGEGRRRRQRRNRRRCSRPSVVLAGAERLRRNACGLKVMLASFLATPPCIFPLSLHVRFLDRFLEILAIRRCAGVPAGAVVVC